MMVAASLVLGSCLVTSVSVEPYYYHEIILHGDGYKPNPFGVPGVEKSSIWPSMGNETTFSRDGTYLIIQEYSGHRVHNQRTEDMIY